MDMAAKPTKGSGSGDCFTVIARSVDTQAMNVPRPDVGLLLLVVTTYFGYCGCCCCYTAAVSMLLLLLMLNAMVRAKGTLANTILHGTVEGTRKRGRPKTVWMDDIKD